MRTTLILSFVLMLSFACEEAIDRSVPSTSTGLIAVEGVLTNENTNHLVKLRIPNSQLNEPTLPAVGAQVRVLEESGPIYQLMESPINSGNYFTPVMRAVFGRTYTLVIDYKGERFVASDRSIAVDRLPDLTYQKLNDSQLYRITSGAGGNVPHYISHYVSWAQTPSCTTQLCEGLQIFYDLKNLDANDIFEPGKTDFTFPGGSTIIRRKHSVSPAYQAFLRSMLSETEWKGSIFDVDRSNTATNLSAGGVGFFAVTTVVADTTIVQ